jgi:endonuclease/exonuclease/phosphatase family metal-dependent hydrolase
MSDATPLRVMTYNVHRCVGRGGTDSFDAVADLCAASSADLIALQELDAPTTDDGDGVHHARDLAARLGMRYLMLRTFRRLADRDYGHAVLSRHPIELRRAALFAAPAGVTWEPRGAIWARVTLGAGRAVDVITTHLGIVRRQRRLEADELVGDGWLGHAELGPTRILCGDLNALPRSAAYRRLTGSLRDAQRLVPGRPRATYPSRLAVARIDHVLVSPDLDVRASDVPRSPAVRRASDHRPLIVDLALR